MATRFHKLVAPACDFLNTRLLMKPRCFMFTILLLLACAPTTTTPEGDTGLPPTHTPALSGHEASGACIQGLVRAVDIGTETPLSYTVEVRYSRGQSEIMQPAPYARASTMVSTEQANMWDSPLYRDGSEITFTCGYAWEASGPTIDGEAAGMAVAYRVSWLVVE